ncbi:MAG TPA: hypothetical protein PLU37_14690 [Chitinophagaceae bacterium]|nr:hypothetical protein [Chitinophagales bacterium]HPG12778.1 hypothetical protein [Chitinophagaceae bacterium]
MNKKLPVSALPLITIFIIVTVFALTAKRWLQEKDIDQMVLVWGNLLLFLVSLVSFMMMYRSLQSSKPKSSVTAMYSGFMIKFFAVALAAFVYIMYAKKEVNKPALIFCAGLYIIYTMFETRALLRTLRQKNNA